MVSWRGFRQSVVFLPLPSPRSRVFTKTEFTDVMCVFIFGVHLDTYSMRTRFLLKGSQYPGGGAVLQLVQIWWVEKS